MDCGAEIVRARLIELRNELAKTHKELRVEMDLKRKALNHDYNRLHAELWKMMEAMYEKMGQNIKDIPFTEEELLYRDLC